MAIGLTEEHEALAASVRGFAERHIPAQVVRQAADATTEERPAFWPALAEQGLLGLHLPEQYGGQGFSLVELAVALEELGRAAAPGPYVPTALASAIILASDSVAAREVFLPGLADGSRTAAVALGSGLSGVRTGDGGLEVRGSLEPVLGAATADLLVLPVAGAGLTGEHWVVVDAADVTVDPLEALDLTRGVGRVVIEGVVVPQERVLAGLDHQPHDLATVVLGAEACGVAGWAVDTAVSYAKMRNQFGRPIGQFQGVKHKCSWMLIGLEKARATVWDAARAQADPQTAPEQRAYATAVAALTATSVAVSCAEDNIQVHGGIGYTWEHDAHLYYRRALSLRALAGRAAVHRQTVAALALDGVRRPMEP